MNENQIILNDALSIEELAEKRQSIQNDIKKNKINIRRNKLLISFLAILISLATALSNVYLNWTTWTGLLFIIVIALSAAFFVVTSNAGPNVSAVISLYVSIIGGAIAAASAYISRADIIDDAIDDTFDAIVNDIVSGTDIVDVDNIIYSADIISGGDIFLAGAVAGTFFIFFRTTAHILIRNKTQLEKLTLSLNYLDGVSPK